jgi:hypothetical protein
MPIPVTSAAPFADASPGNGNDSDLSPWRF